MIIQQINSIIFLESNKVFRNLVFTYSVYRRDINIFKPNFQKYITDLAKVNGCPFIDKNSITNSQ